jgi:regulatory protein
MWPRRPAGMSRPAAEDDGGFEQCAPRQDASPAKPASPRREAGGADEEFEQAEPAGRESVRRSRLSEAGFAAADQAQEPTITAAQLRMKGIGLLARREHSRAELQQKLKRYTPDADLIAQTLDQLQKEKLLSDARFAEGLARVRGARYGSARVAQDLRAKGVSGEMAAGLVRQLKDTDLERAQAAWQKRFGGPAEDAAGRAKQMRFLQSRGFSPDVIRRVVPRARKALPEEADE